MTTPLLFDPLSDSDSESESREDIMTIIYGKGAQPLPPKVQAPMFSVTPDILSEGDPDQCVKLAGYTMRAMSHAQGQYANFYIATRDEDGELFGARVTRDQKDLTKQMPGGPQIHLVIECKRFFTTKFIEIMDLWDGSLADRLGGKMAQDAADFLWRQLDYIHNEGWTHNDITPNNIVVQTYGNGRGSLIINASLIDPNPEPLTEEDAEHDRESLQYVLSRMTIS